jgi:hypothetical protein
MKMIASVGHIFAAAILLVAQDLTGDHIALLRRYHEGEKLTYRMKGSNESWHYEIQADGVVKKDPAGNYFEEYGWSNLVSDNQKVALSPASLGFRQQVSLDPNRNPAIPNLSQVDTRLIGPITDFMTFYADLWLAEKTGQLTHAGDHFLFKHGKPNSWADGTYVLIGEDALDFDFTLKEVKHSENTATLLIRHVPPQNPEINLPAEWMRKPVANTANNWVQVQKMEQGKYLAAVGKETFEVEITLSLIDGKILSGQIDNAVETIERQCADSALTTCGDSKPHSIRRQIAIKLEPRNL